VRSDGGQALGRVRGAAKILDDAARSAGVTSSWCTRAAGAAAVLRPRTTTVPGAGRSTAASALVRHERRRQTQAPWSCDRTAQAFAAVQEEKKPSDMRSSLAQGIGASPAPGRRRCGAVTSGFAKARRATG
jgi:hypothetical protein